MELMDGMRKVLQKNLLRDACGRKIFCECDKVLDAPNAVLVSIKDRSSISCTTCFDAMVERIQNKHPDIDVLAGIEVDDGRKIFGRKK